MAQYYESEPTGDDAFDQESTEKSIKSCYAVVYELENRKWVVAGEGGWSEVHLCEDSLDNSHRILAWTVKSQQVLMNCNVTAECVYKEKSKNFHSFSDENGNRYGLGFHKSESGLKQAAHYLNSVKGVIASAQQPVLNAPPSMPPAPSITYIPSTSQQSPPPSSQQQQQAAQGGDGGGGMPPPAPDQYSVSMSQSQVDQIQDDLRNHSIQQQQQQENANAYQQSQAQPPQPPPAQQQQQYTENKSEPIPDYSQQAQASPEPQGDDQLAHLNGVRSGGAQPSYHLDSSIQQAKPTVPLGPLGNLKILPAKQNKHWSGDKKIKNPTAVEHKVRVTHDKDTGLYTGLPAEWLEHLNKQFGVNPKQLPSVAMAAYQSKIPKVLVTLRSALEKANAYSQVGIFRLAPNAEKNKIMKKRIDKGDLQTAEEKAEDTDVNVYANLIKVWFRDLPDPLLNCVNPDMIEHVSSTEEAAKVVQTMVEPNQSIFLWLCDMCVEISKYEKTNKMSAGNMAIVVGPNLFNTNQFENPMKAMTYSGKVVEFFKHAILWRAAR